MPCRRAIPTSPGTEKGQNTKGTGEGGAGSILAVSLIAAILTVLALIAPLTAILLTKANITGAADAAALAAADTATGLNPGVPCMIAASVAHANGANVRQCRADGVIVTVRVSAQILGFTVYATATAGPPGTGH